ncbi:Aspartate aminotransferase [Fusarium oxysporum f. sp. cubense race 1]|uniref:Aspartate aminotransferase n=1 Tax=Fusarium oxysporum f. sp. cubense (strain race 1) TaxID=1229664 RepID=N4UAX6_FUSC1|nr:Aspartate aminotransferase [Fusarium oxysporum f. sp. cubense race 1]
MVRIAPFAVEQWMDEYETTSGALNVAETCAASVSIDDLVGMCKDPKAQGPIDTRLKLTYGPIPGSTALRERIAAQCSTEDTKLAAEDIVLYEVPRSIGAEVSLWKLKEEESFVPNVDGLINLIRKNTKMIIINNPNNPTGAPIHNSELGRIAQIAKEKGIILFSDEVYRPLFHGGASGQIDIPKPATSLGYERTITTGSMSKGYALAGIRVGWIASKDKCIISAIMAARDYTTISVSQIDDQVARYALSPAVLPSLVDRNLTLARNNAKLVKEFIGRYKAVCSWVEPTAGTTAFVRFIKNGQPINDVDFCLDLLSKNNVLFVAGSKCFGKDEDFKGYIRMGYVCETHVLVEGLKRLGAYIDANLL